MTTTMTGLEFMVNEAAQGFSITQLAINLGWMSAKQIRDFNKEAGLPTGRSANENLLTARRALFGAAKLAGSEPSVFESWDWKHELMDTFECEGCGEVQTLNLYSLRGHGWVINHLRVMCNNCW